MKRGFIYKKHNSVSNTPQTLNVAEITINGKKFIWDFEHSFNQAIKNTLIQTKTRKRKHTNLALELRNVYFIVIVGYKRGEMECTCFIIIPSLD